MTDPSEPDSSRQRGRRVFHGYLLVVVAPVGVILLALAVGVPPHRLRRAVEFQAVALVAALYFIGALRMQSRRARRQRRLESLTGIRFSTPIWMILMEAAMLLEIGGALAAVVATFGFPGVGTGLFLTFALIGVSMPWFKIGVQPRWVVFEQGGLRIGVWRTTFLVPWTTVERTDAIGPDHFVAVNVFLRDPAPVLDSVQPNESKARERIKALIQSSPQTGVGLLLMPWAAGLDGQALERGIREGMSGKVAGMN